MRASGPGGKGAKAIFAPLKIALVFDSGSAPRQPPQHDSGAQPLARIKECACRVPQRQVDAGRNARGGSVLHQIGISQLSLVEATLKTGRTHQIRVHMQSQHCPIAGDERYGDYQANRRLPKIGLRRMFLHAARLKLRHPLSGEPLTLEAPLPDDLQNLLVMLKAA